MALFGEICEPTSRAVWESFDSDEESDHKLEWANKWRNPERASVFILAEGRSASEYAERCVLSSATIFNEIFDAKLKLYVTPHSDAVICICPLENVTTAGDITFLLSPILKISKKIVVLKSRSVTDYSSDDMNFGTSCIIRALHTDATKDVANVTLLEQPNIISGLSAGVMSYCQHLGLPASLYVCYTDNPNMDSSIAFQITTLLEKLNIKVHTDFTPKPMVSTNLYM